MDNENRKIIRLKNYDYSKGGAYFITICIYNRVHLLGEIIKGELFSKENSPHKIIEKYLKDISVKFPGTHVTKYVIMPDYIHFILIINGRKYGLCDIIRWFKTMTTTEYIKGVKNELYKPFDKHLWQRNYYEHIIRDEKDYFNKYKYIINNPLKWQLEWGI